MNSLPKLSGTPKQIAWAEDIRKEKVTGFSLVEKEVVDSLLAETAAEFWIENRNLSPKEIVRRRGRELRRGKGVVNVACEVEALLKSVAALKDSPMVGQQISLSTQDPSKMFEIFPKSPTAKEYKALEIDGKLPRCFIYDGEEIVLIGIKGKAFVLAHGKPTAQAREILEEWIQLRRSGPEYQMLEGNCWAIEV